jgi:hypothetical protein
MTEHAESVESKDPLGRITDMEPLSWTRVEDLELHRLLHKHGKDWELVAGHFPDRTSRSIQAWVETTQTQCWTSAEDRKLKVLVQIYGLDWRVLGRHLGHTSSEVKSRYYQVHVPMDLETSLSLKETDDKKRHLTEMYRQVEIMQSYLAGLQSAMGRLQKELSETLD